MTNFSKDQILGCLFGGAIGDAMGGSYEGKLLHAPLNEDGPWRLSDDTQLTLATCEAITAHGSPQPEAIAQSFVSWFQTHRLSGLGASTLKALRDLNAGAHWALAGRKGDRAAGNGAAMRIAPLAFCLDPQEPNDRQLVRDVCRITHHNDEAYVGALAVVRAIDAITRTSGNELLSWVVEELPKTAVRERLVQMTKLKEQAAIAEIGHTFGNSGYVVESVPLAIYRASFADRIGFEQLLKELIAVGGDTDTIASIAGQIVGTRLGYARLPEYLLNRLPEHELISSIAEQFASVVGGSHPKR